MQTGCLQARKRKFISVSHSPKACPIASPSRAFLAPREHNWPPLLPAAALSSFRLAQAPSDVAHGHRKLKIKQRAVVTAHTEPSATHSSAGIMTQRAAMANVLVSQPPSPSIPPPSRAKQTVPPLIPVQKTYQQLWKHLCSRHKCEPGSSSPPKTTFEKSFRLGTTSTAAQRFKG